MEFLVQLFTGESVAHAVLILSLVAALGLALGCLRLGGVNLGIAGVLFAGLLFGHFGFTIDLKVMEFMREFGLILFVYAIGMQVGPGFIASLKRDGLRLNIMAASIVMMGVLITVALVKFAGINMVTAVGLFSGATTNTPSLAAAQQALKDIPFITEESLKLPGIGYAVAYPFGILGIVLTMILIRVIFRIQPAKETESQVHTDVPLSAVNLEIVNQNLNGRSIKSIPILNEAGVVVSRILHNGQLSVAQLDTVIYQGDVILAVGIKQKLEQLKVVAGKESSIDLRTLPSNIVAKNILVTKQDVVGKTLQALDLFGRYGVTVTRINRSDVELTASPNIRLQFADTLLVVGDTGMIGKAAGELGNSPKHLDHPHVIPIFIGIALGVILGSVPIYLPGMSLPVKLGLAGGPLIVAIILSRIRHIGPVIWYLPVSANFMLREIGIVLFLACVGLKAGDQFVNTLTHGQGLYWMACAALITFVPIMLVGLFARLRYGMNYLSLCGLLAGSMTDPPALAFANQVANSNAQSISYATVYPLVMLLRVIAAQMLVFFFVR